ncbi:MAG TPA: methyltransferase domain-containing protein [Planctomycetota bacterium]|nr:methyltransferase domain-containing protein [Planctomycetota bacterium]
MSRRSPLLERGSRSHYENAAYYDQTYRRRRADVEFYVAAAERLGGPVLELGAGTGRVSRKLAASGVEVIGVDSTEAMVEAAERHRAKMKGAARDRLSLVLGDIFEVRVGRRFPLVISPFNVFMHVYDRRELALALETVRAHLAPGGYFVFDVLVPDPEALARDPERVYRGRNVRLPPERTLHRYGERFEYDPVTQIQTVTMIFEEIDPPHRVVTQTLTHRQWFPAELEALLHYEGFEIVERFGDFERGPLDEYSESQILVTRAVTP